MIIVGAVLFFAALLIVGVLLSPSSAAPRVVRLAVVRNDQVSSSRSARLGARVEALADRVLARSGRRGGLATALDVAAIQIRPGEYVVLCLAGGVVAGLALATINGVLGFMVGLVGASLFGRWYVNSRATRRRRQFDEQLPDVLHLMVSLLRSGYGLPQALDAVAHQTSDPAAAEFKRVLFETRIGRDTSDALASTAERMQSKDFEWVVQAMRINHEVGGEMAAILDGVGETVRERQRLGRQILALTAEGRLSAVLLTAIPPFLVLMLSVLSPGYFEPMTHSPGPLLVIGGVLLLLVGWVWTRRIVKLHT